MRYFNTILILIVILISSFLLIGNRFNFKWAGGNGTAKHQIAILPAYDSPYATFKRGEIISTITPPYDAESNYSKTPLYVEFGNEKIWLDKNTEIKLIDDRENNLEINVIQGRIIIEGDITIDTRDTKTKINGIASFVHYSWLDKIEVAKINGNIEIQTSYNKTVLPENTTVRCSTLKPFICSQVPFDPENSSAANFYKNLLEN